MNPEHSTPSILVVIVNYKTGALTIDCLGSLQGEMEANPGARVVVTDNDSGDGSIEAIAKAIADRGWSAWAVAQPLGKNGGFAFGNNGAIAPALKSDHPPDYVWLLNPDTVVRPGALKELVRFLETHPDAGLAGSRLEDPDGTRQMSAFPFPTLLGEFNHGARFGPLHRRLPRWACEPEIHETNPVQADWVAGASLLVRKAVFDRIGLLDDGFFMYYEEVDFCLRARREGWTCWYVPTSKVVHLVGQSSGVTDRTRKARRVPGYWFEARRRFFQRNHGRWRTLLADLAWTSGALTFFARNLIQRKPGLMPDRYFQDFVRHNFIAPVKPR